MTKQYVDIDEFKDMGIRYTFADMLDTLLEAQNKNVLVSCNFHGHMYYSDSVDIKAAYLDYYDMTKEEMDYYYENVDVIPLNMLRSITPYRYVRKEMFEDFVSWIVPKHAPDLLQIYELISKILGRCEVEKSVERLNKMNNDRKEVAYDFIDKYFTPAAKEYLLSITDIKEPKKQQETTITMK